MSPEHALRSCCLRLGHLDLERGEDVADLLVDDRLKDALRAAGGAIVTDSHNPYHRVWELLSDPERSRGTVKVTSR